MNDLKTPGLNNPETYVLTHNRFITYIVLIFTDLKKAQIYKMLYRNSPHQEIVKVMSFDYLHLFGPDEDNKDGNFLFEIEDKKFVHVGKSVFSFETNDEFEDYYSERGYNDVKYSFARGKENIYFMLHQNVHNTSISHSVNLNLFNFFFNRYMLKHLITWIIKLYFQNYAVITILFKSLTIERFYINTIHMRFKRKSTFYFRTN